MHGQCEEKNATYALTVQQNLTMNSTVYDTDMHGSLELEFVIYNTSHPCEDAMSCTPQAIFVFQESRNISETNGMEAWHEDNISYPYALNISHLAINVTTHTSNEELVPLDNIIVQRERFGLFRMKIVPLPFRVGSTSITVEIHTKGDSVTHNISNETNTSQIISSGADSINSTITQNQSSNSRVSLIINGDNSSLINCSNNIYCPKYFKLHSGRPIESGFLPKIL